MKNKRKVLDVINGKFEKYTRYQQKIRKFRGQQAVKGRATRL